MYLALYTLLMAGAAWGAWRSNPLYSNRGTVQYVVVVTLAVASLMTASIGVANLTKNSPAPVTFASLGALILFGTMGLIWLLVTICTPKTAALPHGTKLVRVRRAMLIPWARRLGWAILILTVLAFAVPGNAKGVVYALGAILLLLGLVMLFAGYIVALHADRSLTSIEVDPWVHWSYAADEWKAWIDVEAAQADAVPHWIWRRDWKRLVIPLLAVTAGIYLSDMAPSSLVWDTEYAAFIWALMFGLLFFAVRSSKTAGRRLRLLMAKAPPDTYFGAAGVFADGTYTEWQTDANYLLSATLDDGPPRSLTLSFAKMAAGSAALQQVRLSVLIPTGADGDVARLQGALSSACPTAQIALAAPLTALIVSVKR
jgi:hypothetical protein